jgi:MSHA pilin protein MshC
VGRNYYRRSTGFTLVELIVVIMLIAIMAVYASSRFIGVASFSAHAAQQQGIAVIRQIQLGRMQSNISNQQTLHNRYRLVVADKCLGSVEACQSTSNPETSMSNKVVIHEQDMSFLSNSRFDFDLYGNPTCTGDCTLKEGEFLIQIASDVEQASICINRQGYVYGC